MRAQNLELTTTPSQLARKIMDLLCKNDPPLQNCCCEDTISGMWRRRLPDPVQQAIAGMPMGGGNLETVLQRADDVYATLGISNSPQVGANAAAAQDPQLAAFGKGSQNKQQKQNGPGQKKNQNQGGQKQNQNQNKNQNNTTKPRRGKRHEDGPPDTACDRHWKYGKNCWYCVKPLKCPWKDYIVPSD